MTLRLVIFFLFLSLNAGATLIDSVRSISTETISSYSKYEAGIAVSPYLTEEWINPYDPNHADIYAVFTGPNGSEYRRDAFWYQPFRRCNDCQNQVFNPEEPCSWKDRPERLDPNDPDAYLRAQPTSFPWRVRFAPPAAGSWSYRVFVHSPFGDDTSRQYSFIVTPSDNKGYIGQDKATPSRYFQYKSNGEVFIPLGLNCLRVPPISNGDTIYSRIAMMVVTEMMEQASAYGCNFLRIMMGPENFGLEWKTPQGGVGDYSYRQNRAFDLDSVLEKAAEKKVYLHLVLSTNGEMQIADWWENNPYREKNGGFIKNADEFLSSERARDIFKRRLRYVVARWGYSPYIMSYEPMQEVDLYGTSNNKGNFWAKPGMLISWYREMIQYIKTKDTNHLFTVSASSNGSGRYGPGGGVYALPEVDYINEHHYGADYNVAFQRNYIDRMDRKFFPDKPMMYGEMGNSFPKVSGPAGLSFTKKPIYNDNEWHNALWSTSLGGDAGPGLGWLSFIDMVHPQELYPQCWGGQYKYFKPLSLFLQQDSIFYKDPQPIANRCTGRGPKDNIWRDTCKGCPFPYDLTANPCLCFSGVDVHEKKVRPELVSTGISTTNDSLIEVFGLKADDRVIGWVHNKRNYWYELPHFVGGDSATVAYLKDNCPDINNIPVLSNDSMSIAGLSEGKYQIVFYSTWPDYDVNFLYPGKEDGGVIPEFAATAVVGSTGEMKFKLPTLRAIAPDDETAPYGPDYGFKVRKLPD
jgi:hypothetical protein